MKRYLFILIILSVFCFEGIVHAKWYTFNEDNKAIALTKYEPDVNDLNSRNEFAVFSNANIKLRQAEYRGGKVKVRIKSQAEKDSDAAKATHEAEHAINYESAKAKLMSVVGLTEDEIHAISGH